MRVRKIYGPSGVWTPPCTGVAGPMGGGGGELAYFTGGDVTFCETLYDSREDGRGREYGT